MEDKAQEWLDVFEMYSLLLADEDDDQVKLHFNKYDFNEIYTIIREYRETCVKIIEFKKSLAAIRNYIVNCKADYIYKEYTQDDVLEILNELRRWFDE